MFVVGHQAILFEGGTGLNERTCLAGPARAWLGLLQELASSSPPALLFLVTLNNHLSLLTARFSHKEEGGVR
jgi:hypothetical protein